MNYDAETFDLSLKAIDQGESEMVQRLTVIFVHSINQKSARTGLPTPRASQEEVPSATHHLTLTRNRSRNFLPIIKCLDNLQMQKFFSHRECTTRTATDSNPCQWRNIYTMKKKNGIDRGQYGDESAKS
jgi:hypothetical protein